MLRPKGTPGHRALGRVYLVLMGTTAVVSLWLPAAVGPRWLDHFGFIHGLSVLTLVTVPLAWLAVRGGHVAVHRAAMIGLYCGGLLIAGAFAFAPGRLLHRWLFGGG